MSDLRHHAVPRCRIVVSIINYRTATMTQDCLRSVLADFEASGLGDAAHAVVVDNASGDGSAEVLAEWIAAEGLGDRVTLVASDTNSGFSGGHNRGIGARAADFYLVLNSDALLRPGFCQAILAAAEAEPQAGLFAPRIEYDDGIQQISCFRFPSPISEIIRGAGSGPVTRLLSRWDIPLEMPPAPDQIGWASFACILLRGTMIEQLGPMDEGYFLYFEDTEYCLRARRAGWRVVYVPQARAVHFRGGSAPVKALAAARKRLPAYFYASRTRFLRQGYGALGPLAGNLCWYLGRAIAQARRFAGKPVPTANAAEARDIWVNFGTPLGDRRAPDGAGQGAQ